MHCSRLDQFKPNVHLPTSLLFCTFFNFSLPFFVLHLTESSQICSRPLLDLNIGEARTSRFSKVFFVIGFSKNPNEYLILFIAEGRLKLEFCQKENQTS
jgi:hypothetical protein